MPATAYLAATTYKLDDFRPFLYQDERLRQDLDEDRQRHSGATFHARDREDPNRQGTAVRGHGVRACYVSFDDGANWQPFQLNLPVVPITDVAFHKRDKELVVATQGRSFWILDELPLLYQLNPQAEAESAHLFTPKDTYRAEGGGRGGRGFAGAASARIPRAAW